MEGRKRERSKGRVQSESGYTTPMGKGKIADRVTDQIVALLKK